MYIMIAIKVPVLIPAEAASPSSVVVSKVDEGINGKGVTGTRELELRESRELELRRGVGEVGL